VTSRAPMRLFTEAVKGGLGGNENGFHTHLVVHNPEMRAGVDYEQHIPLDSLNDISKHHALLSHPDTEAHLHIGIGDRPAVARAKDRMLGDDDDEGPYPWDFHTHVHLKKEAGTDTFIPKYMYTNEKQRRKGWGTTLWNHVDRKLKTAGFGLEHDWSCQTPDGHVWSRKSSGVGSTTCHRPNSILNHEIDSDSEWHTLTAAQKDAFRGHADPLLTKSKGMVGDPEVHAVRKQMKRKHGVDLHPYTVANVMSGITGDRWRNNYHGSVPLRDLEDSWRESKKQNLERRESGQAPRRAPRRTRLVKQKEKSK